MNTITYRYRGEVERGTGNTAKHPLPSYKWFAGYSEDRGDGITLFPWMTKKECRRDAESQDKRPVFKER